MKISYNLLKKYLPIDLAPESLDDLLTSSGLEVENYDEIESVKGGLRGVLIGEVMEKEKHPDADRLSITKVNVGKQELVQIVCGASNVAKGQKVLVALPGAKLFPSFGDSFDIKISKIRGQISEGMICAEDEVGLGKSHDGIMVLDAHAVPGTPAAEYFKIEEDVVFEIGLTPNRADAMSHIGVARDLEAVLKTRSLYENNFPYKAVPLLIPSVALFKSGTKKSAVKISIEDKACLRYSGLSISGIQVKESPAWLKNALLAVGVKPVNNIVDIANFVMVECGQPLHAFDAAKVKGKIVVKKLPAGTLFTTLDQLERKLSGHELMICNEHEPLCMAGVFGGLNSGITEQTKEIFLESAYFNPADVRLAAKAHGLKTESSFRFERGTDYLLTVYALQRAAMLMLEVAGGEIPSEIIDVYPNPIEPRNIEVSFEGIRRLSGISLADETIEEICIRCGMGIVDKTKTGLSLFIPSYKTDVVREADVVEEILRTYGYHHIPIPEKISFSFSTHNADAKPALQKKISHHLAANGFLEIMSNSLTSHAYVQKFMPDEPVVKILNPLSNALDILRPNMLFTALETLQYNSNRKNNSVRFYEFGKTYTATEKGAHEQHKIMLLVAGNLQEANWHKQENKATFFYLKSIIENTADLFASAMKDSFKWVEGEHPLFSMYAGIQSRKITLGLAGSVKKHILKHFDIAQDVFYAELNMDALINRASSMKSTIYPAPKFPEVRRDLSMVLDASVSYNDIKELAMKQDKKLLRSVSIFDVYQGENIEQGKKSYALSFVLRDDENTLTDTIIDQVMHKLEAAFVKNLGAVVRR
jgi:phenylalanyl-tRNA synthetase beta chain